MGADCKLLYHLRTNGFQTEEKCIQHDNTVAQLPQPAQCPFISNTVISYEGLPRNIVHCSRVKEKYIRGKHAQPNSYISWTICIRLACEQVTDTEHRLILHRNKPTTAALIVRGNTDRAFWIVWAVMSTIYGNRYGEFIIKMKHRLGWAMHWNLACLMHCKNVRFF